MTERPNGRDLNVVTLREYIEALLREHAQMHAEQAKAIQVAVEAQNARLQGMNEFRSSIADVVSNTVSRQTYEIAHEQLEQRVDSVAKDMRGRIDDVGKDANSRVTREVFDQRSEAVDGRIAALETWRARATGIGLVLVLFAGVIGAAIAKALGG